MRIGLIKGGGIFIGVLGFLFCYNYFNQIQEAIRGGERYGCFYFSGATASSTGLFCHCSDSLESVVILASGSVLSHVFNLKMYENGFQNSSGDFYGKSNSSNDSIDIFHLPDEEVVRIKYFRSCESLNDTTLFDSLHLIMQPVFKL